MKFSKKTFNNLKSKPGFTGLLLKCTLEDLL